MPRRVLLALAFVATLGGAARAQLPAEWHGFWRGACKLEPPHQGEARFDASLNIAPRGERRVSWTLTYHTRRGTQVRDYELIAGDTPNTFALDEKNGLILDKTLAGRTLFAGFTIGSQFLDASYELLGDRLVMSIRSFTNRPARETCLTNQPQTCVNTFPFASLQRCELAKGEAPALPSGGLPARLP